MGYSLLRIAMRGCARWAHSCFHQISQLICPRSVDRRRFSERLLMNWPYIRLQTGASMSVDLISRQTAAKPLDVGFLRGWHDFNFLTHHVSFGDVGIFVGRSTNAVFASDRRTIRAVARGAGCACSAADRGRKKAHRGIEAAPPATAGCAATSPATSTAGKWGTSRYRR